MVIMEEDQHDFDLHQQDIFTQHGVPPELYPVFKHASVDAVLAACRQMLEVDVDALNSAISALYQLMAIDLMDSERRCLCGRSFKMRDLRESSLPGLSFMRICDDCLAREQKRERRRLAQRGIRSALARARAARLPATLTEMQWERTVKHFQGLCAYCQESPWYVVEHAKPILLGGGSTADNCVPACFKCNSSKGMKALEEIGGPHELYFREEKLAVVREWLKKCAR